MYFTYRQNNSDGYVITNDTYAKYVIIQAVTAKEADERADELGMFDLPYCKCCGVRFREQYDDDDGEDFPAIYGKPLSNLNPVQVDTFGRDDRSSVIVYRLRGEPELYHANVD